MNNKLTISARLSELSILRAAVGSFIGSSLDDCDKGRVILAIDEAASNIIVHGYKNDESKSINVEMKSGPESFTFILSDTAGGFNPLEVSPPDIDNYHETGKESGLGVDSYRRIMKVDYETDKNGGNRLILVKEIKHEES